VKVSGNVRSTDSNDECPKKYADIQVTEPIPGPWWQAVGGDAVSGGGILRSILPSGLRLILNNTAGYPGVAIYNGTLSLGEGSVSSKGWSADTAYDDKAYSYDRFVELAPADASWNQMADLIAGGSATGDYEWFKRDGDYTLSSDLMISGGRKIILYVSGNLDINANIRLRNPQRTFFMAIVGGDITVGDGVTNVEYGVARGKADAYALEGIYYADGRFRSGTGANPLRVRGSVVANNVRLRRDLQAANGTTPAEVFEFGDESLLLYPKELTNVTVAWKEVAP
jgi:hypothetical protein